MAACQLQMYIMHIELASSKSPPRLQVLLQVITTFLGSLLVGSFLNQITEFLNNPGGIVSTLGSSAPQTATFFMTFILIQAFIKQPLQLLRLPGLIIFWLKSRFATTPRQKAAVWQDARLKYGRNVSVPLAVFSISLLKEHAVGKVRMELYHARAVQGTCAIADQVSCVNYSQRLQVGTSKQSVGGITIAVFSLAEPCFLHAYDVSCVCMCCACHPGCE